MLIAVDYLQCGPLRPAATFSLALADRPEDRIGNVRAPVLVVRGTRDGLTSPQWARQLADAAPDGRVVEVPDGTHTLNYSAPAAFVAAVHPFLLGEPT